jgi:RNA polymerase sigma-70 factor (ECF subfamily)
LLRIAHNLIADHCRLRDRERHMLSQVVLLWDAPVDFEADVVCAIDAQRASAPLRAGIGKLHEGEREVLRLSLAGLTHREIAGVLQICEGTVKSRLFRAKVKLRGEWDIFAGLGKPEHRDP